VAAIVGEAAKLEAAVGLTLGVVAWPLHAVVKIAAANIEIAIRRLSTNGRASQWIGRITWISCLRSAVTVVGRTCGWKSFDASP
jgi:hypothetical protein